MSWVRVGEAERRREQGGGVVAGARDAADEGKVARGGDLCVVAFGADESQRRGRHYNKIDIP